MAGASLVAQMVKNPPVMWEMWVRYLGWEDPLEESMATHSTILAWRMVDKCILLFLLFFFSFKDTLENQNGRQMFFCYFFLRYPRKPEKQVTLVLNWGVLSRQKEEGKKKGEITVLWWEKIYWTWNHTTREIEVGDHNILWLQYLLSGDFSQLHSAQRHRNGRGKDWAPWGTWDGG